jgi:hypothetical protein
MQKQVQQRLNTELRELIREASVSLARLDAGRLEELALSCQTLNRALSPSGRGSRVDLARQTLEAAGEMVVFGRVLEATRANLDVLNRLREGREARLEYRGSAGVHSGLRAGGLG